MRYTIYYGWFSAAVYAYLLAVAPGIVVACSPAGPWQGNGQIATLKNGGINFFEYLDGGYEAAVPGPIPNDLESNLMFIQKIATAGAYGIFLDQVSSYPDATKRHYLSQIYAKAHELGLKVAFNTGVDNWADSLMQYCDYMNSSEIWDNEPLSPSQCKWLNTVWLLTQGVTSEARAVELTKAALEEGIGAHYACNAYGALPDFYVSYMSQIKAGPTEPPEGGDMAQITLGAPEEVEIGKTFDVAVNIDTVAAFDAGQFDILFDITNTEFVSVSGGDIGGTVIPVAAFNLIEAGHLRVVLNIPGLQGADGAGSLATVKLKALKAMEETTIEIENGFINNNQAVEIEASWEGCVLSFFLTGDFNGDGLVGEDDISYLARIIVDLEPTIPEADINSDGRVNTADLTTLKRMIAGL